MNRFEQQLYGAFAAMDRRNNPQPGNETMTTTTTQTTAAGTRVCTIGRDGSKMAGPHNQLFTGKIYEAIARKDGVLTWRLVGKFGGTRSGKGGPSKSFTAEVQAAAMHDWKSVANNQICD